MNTQEGGERVDHSLIIGAGPTAVQTAVLAGKVWKGDISIACRDSIGSRQLKRYLYEHHHTLKVEGKDGHSLSGKVTISHFYEGFHQVEDRYSTIILCTPSDSYEEILNALEVQKRKRVKTVILLSPGLGANQRISNLVNDENMEVISLSNYYAATKFKEDSCIAFTKSVKKRIYAASNTEGPGLDKVRLLLEYANIDVVVKNHPIEAECRNITTYVHPPFFINDFSLNETLSDTKSLKSLYKLYPEGPVTPLAISEMVKLWKELSILVERLGGEPINLLQFLHDDNYPVKEEALSRSDIEGFSGFETTKQEYLLYIRYASLLIDPFSVPDENGRYFEFSRVPYPQVSHRESGEWVMPRIPMEDYLKLMDIRSLGHESGTNMPLTNHFIQRFEQRVTDWQSQTGRTIKGFCKGVEAREVPS